jgi:hypothetical protein
LLGLLLFASATDCEMAPRISQEEQDAVRAGDLEVDPAAAQECLAAIDAAETAGEPAARPAANNPCDHLFVQVR